MVKSTGFLPTGIVIADVQRTGEHALAGGGFADIWKGVWKSETVALKVMRSFQIGVASARSVSSVSFTCFHEIGAIIFFRNLRRKPLYGGDCTIPTSCLSTEYAQINFTSRLL